MTLAGCLFVADIFVFFFSLVVASAMDYVLPKLKETPALYSECKFIRLTMRITMVISILGFIATTLFMYLHDGV